MRALPKPYRLQGRRWRHRVDDSHLCPAGRQADLRRRATNCGNLRAPLPGDGCDNILIRDLQLSSEFCAVVLRSCAPARSRKGLCRPARVRTTVHCDSKPAKGLCCLDREGWDDSNRTPGRPSPFPFSRSHSGGTRGADEAHWRSQLIGVHPGASLALKQKPTRIRYRIVLMLFIASCFSYGDRVMLSITGIAFSKDLHLDALKLGYLFSGFSWAYVVGQLPAGGLLDRFGSKRVYGISIVGWSLCAILPGFPAHLPATAAFIVIFGLRLVSGLVQSPVFPGNGRIVASWFPTSERGRASAIFNASQYFSLVLFAPILGWITHLSVWKD